MIRFLWARFLGSLLVLLTIACSQDPKPLQLNKAQQINLDSIFTSMEDSLKSEFDSLCIQHYDSLYQLAVDSVKTLRIQEIKEPIQ